MASLLHSIQAANKDTVMTPDGANDLVPVFGDYTLAAALVINDIIEMVPLPAGCVPVDVIVDTPDLDAHGTPLITLDVGIMSGEWGAAGSRTIGAEFLAASTIGKTGGIAHADVSGFTRIVPSTADRSIGIKVAAAPATGASSGTIRLTLLFRSQRDSL